jgi:hypothetical protein
MPTTRILPDLNKWLTLNLQLIVFPHDPAAALQENWWERLTHEPTYETRRKRTERIDVGQYNDLHLTVTADLQKIAWSIDAQVRADDPPESLPSIGPYPAVRDRFMEMMTPWLNEGCPEIKRIGFAGTLAQPVSDHEAAYRRLDEYLVAVQVDPGSTDFNYRVNRQKPSDLNIPGLFLNRLSTWSALKMQTSFQAVTQPDIPPSTVLRNDYYVCMLQFDINTPADRMEPLPREMLSDSFRELVNKATEIAEQGDRP